MAALAAADGLHLLVMGVIVDSCFVLGCRWASGIGGGLGSIVVLSRKGVFIAGAKAAPLGESHLGIDFNKGRNSEGCCFVIRLFEQDGYI